MPTQKRLMQLISTAAKLLNYDTSNVIAPIKSTTGRHRGGDGAVAIRKVVTYVMHHRFGMELLDIGNMLGIHRTTIYHYMKSVDDILVMKTYDRVNERIKSAVETMMFSDTKKSKLNDILNLLLSGEIGKFKAIQLIEKEYKK